MEFLKEFPLYWLGLIGFGFYAFMGFFTVLVLNLCGEDGKPSCDVHGKYFKECSACMEIASRDHSVFISLIFWFWPIPFICLVGGLFLMILNLPGRTLQKFFKWRDERRERQKKVTEEEIKSLPECMYCHKKSGILTSGTDCPSTIYYHEDCKREATGRKIQKVLDL